MWWDVAADVLLPAGDVRGTERIGEQRDPDTIRVMFRVPGAFRRALDESGWLADEVVAAGSVRQGKPPSVLGMITGHALIELARPRRSKTLPREFALAVTAGRVVAFAMSPWKEGDGETVHVLAVKRGEIASWPRGSVAVSDGMLELAGGERFPVTADGDPGADALLDLLARR